VLGTGMIIVVVSHSCGVFNLARKEHELRLAIGQFRQLQQYPDEIERRQATPRDRLEDKAKPLIYKDFGVSIGDRPLDPSGLDLPGGTPLKFHTLPA
jgi:hypothetical protein